MPVALLTLPDVSPTAFPFARSELWRIFRIALQDSMFTFHSSRIVTCAKFRDDVTPARVYFLSAGDTMPRRIITIIGEPLLFLAVKNLAVKFKNNRLNAWVVNNEKRIINNHQDFPQIQFGLSSYKWHFKYLPDHKKLHTRIGSSVGLYS